MQRDSNPVFVTLGSSSTRSILKPVDLTNQLFDHDINASQRHEVYNSSQHRLANAGKHDQ